MLEHSVIRLPDKNIRWTRLYLIFKFNILPLDFESSSGFESWSNPLCCHLNLMDTVRMQHGMYVHNTPVVTECTTPKNSFTLRSLNILHIPLLWMYTSSDPVLLTHHHNVLDSELMGRRKKNWAFLIFTLTLHRVHSCARLTPSPIPVIFRDMLQLGQ